MRFEKFGHGETHVLKISILNLIDSSFFTQCLLLIAGGQLFLNFGRLVILKTNLEKQWDDMGKYQIVYVGVHEYRQISTLY